MQVLESDDMVVKSLSVPVGLEELMEGLTREVLLKRPADIYAFASEYFSKLLGLREKGCYKGRPPKQVRTVTKKTIPPAAKSAETKRPNPAAASKLVLTGSDKQAAAQAKPTKAKILERRWSKKTIEERVEERMADVKGRMGRTPGRQELVEKRNKMTQKPSVDESGVSPRTAERNTRNIQERNRGRRSVAEKQGNVRKAGEKGKGSAEGGAKEQEAKEEKVEGKKKEDAKVLKELKNGAVIPKQQIKEGAEKEVDQKTKKDAIEPSSKGKQSLDSNKPINEGKQNETENTKKGDHENSGNPTNNNKNSEKAKENNDQNKQPQKEAMNGDVEKLPKNKGLEADNLEKDAPRLTEKEREEEKTKSLDLQENQVVELKNGTEVLVKIDSATEQIHGKTTNPETPEKATENPQDTDFKDGKEKTDSKQASEAQYQAASLEEKEERKTLNGTKKETVEGKEEKTKEEVKNGTLIDEKKDGVDTGDKELEKIVRESDKEDTSKQRLLKTDSHLELQDVQKLGDNIASEKQKIASDEKNNFNRAAKPMIEETSEAKETIKEKPKNEQEKAKDVTEHQTVDDSEKEVKTEKSNPPNGNQRDGEAEVVGAKGESAKGPLEAAKEESENTVENAKENEKQTYVRVETEQTKKDLGSLKREESGKSSDGHKEKVAASIEKELRQDATEGLTIKQQQTPATAQILETDATKPKLAKSASEPLKSNNEKVKSIEEKVKTATPPSTPVSESEIRKKGIFEKIGEAAGTVAKTMSSVLNLSEDEQKKKGNEGESRQREERVIDMKHEEVRAITIDLLAAERGTKTPPLYDSDSELEAAEKQAGLVSAINNCSKELKTSNETEEQKGDEDRIKRKVAAVVKIQSFFRGFLTRKKLQAAKKDKEKEGDGGSSVKECPKAEVKQKSLETIDDASVAELKADATGKEGSLKKETTSAVIQTPKQEEKPVTEELLTSELVATTETSKNPNETPASDFQKQVQAAMAIQTFFRNLTAKKRRAATKIQANFRGYLTRKTTLRRGGTQGQPKLSEEEMQRALEALDNIEVPAESPTGSRGKREADGALLRSVTVEEPEVEKKHVSVLGKSQSVGFLFGPASAPLGSFQVNKKVVSGDTSESEIVEEKVVQKSKEGVVKQSGDLIERTGRKEKEVENDVLNEDVNRVFENVEEKSTAQLDIDRAQLDKQDEIGKKEISSCDMKHKDKPDDTKTDIETQSKKMEENVKDSKEKPDNAEKGLPSDELTSREERKVQDFKEFEDTTKKVSFEDTRSSVSSEQKEENVNGVDEEKRELKPEGTTDSSKQEGIKENPKTTEAKENGQESKKQTKESLPTTSNETVKVEVGKDETRDIPNTSTPEEAGKPGEIVVNGEKSEEANSEETKVKQGHAGSDEENKKDHKVQDLKLLGATFNKETHDNKKVELSVTANEQETLSERKEKHGEHLVSITKEKSKDIEEQANQGHKTSSVKESPTKREYETDKEDGEKETKSKSTIQTEQKENKKLEESKDEKLQGDKTKPASTEEAIVSTEKKNLEENKQAEVSATVAEKATTKTDEGKENAIVHKEIKSLGDNCKQDIETLVGKKGDEKEHVDDKLEEKETQAAPAPTKTESVEEINRETDQKAEQESKALASREKKLEGSSSNEMKDEAKTKTEGDKDEIQNETPKVKEIENVTEKAATEALEKHLEKDNAKEHEDKSAEVVPQKSETKSTEKEEETKNVHSLSEAGIETGKDEETKQHEEKHTETRHEEIKPTKSENTSEQDKPSDVLSQTTELTDQKETVSKTLTLSDDQNKDRKNGNLKQQEERTAGVNHEEVKTIAKDNGKEPDKTAEASSQKIEMPNTAEEEKAASRSKEGNNGGVKECDESKISEEGAISSVPRDETLKPKREVIASTNEAFIQKGKSEERIGKETKEEEKQTTDTESVSENLKDEKGQLDKEKQPAETKLSSFDSEQSHTEIQEASKTTPEKTDEEKKQADPSVDTFLATPLDQQTKSLIHGFIEMEKTMGTFKPTHKAAKSTEKTEKCDETGEHIINSIAKDLEKSSTIEAETPPRNLSLEDDDNKKPPPFCGTEHLSYENAPTRPLSSEDVEILPSNAELMRPLSMESSTSADSIVTVVPKPDGAKKAEAGEEGRNLDEDLAAAKIQAAYRGHRARRDLKESSAGEDRSKQKGRRPLSSQTAVREESEEEPPKGLAAATFGEGPASPAPLTLHIRAEVSSPPKLLHSSELHDTAVPKAEAPPGLVHTGEMHDTALPVAVQSPGAEGLTSRRRAHRLLSGGVADVAQSDADMEQKRVNSSIVKNRGSVEAQAATKIQASFRGYQVRKQLKQKDFFQNGLSKAQINQRRQTKRKGSSDSLGDPRTRKEIEERSATKIQAGVRGFLVRKRQKNANKKEPAEAS